MLPNMNQAPLSTPWTFEKVEEAEAHFLTLVAEAREAEPFDPTVQIDGLCQLARAQSIQGKHDEAKQSLDYAERILGEEETNYRVSAKLAYLLERGRVFVAERIPSQARPFFAQAWTLAMNAGEDLYAVDAAQMLAMIEPQKVRKEWVLRAIKLAEASEQPRSHLYLADLYATLGWMQFDVKQTDEALASFQRALSNAKANPSNTIRIRIGKWTVARCLRALHRYDEALDIQKDILAELNETNSRDGFVFEELAECLQSLKKPNEAMAYFEMAHEVLSKDEWFADNKPDRLRRLKDLSKPR